MCFALRNNLLMQLTAERLLTRQILADVGSLKLHFLKRTPRKIHFRWNENGNCLRPILCFALHNNLLMQLIAERLLMRQILADVGSLKLHFLEGTPRKKIVFENNMVVKKYRNFWLITNLILLVHILHSDLSYQVIQMILQVQHQVLEFSLYLLIEVVLFPNKYCESISPSITLYQSY